METDEEKKREALRFKAIAEEKFNNLNYKSALKYAKKAYRLSSDLEGLSSMFTAFDILKVASESSSDSTKDWYKILQVEPFSHINTIKKQYKKLALVLHPDKNPALGCEEAFKIVGEGFRIFSDKIRRKEYDTRLRIKMQEDNVHSIDEKLTFWTACSRCRLLHQFERKYLGHNLICPSCEKRFMAVEVEEGGADGKNIEGEGSGFTVKESNEPGAVEAGAASESGTKVTKRKMTSVGELLARSKPQNLEDEEVLERAKEERENFEEETMTLAEWQFELKKRVKERKLKKMKTNLKEMEKDGGEKEKNKEMKENEMKTERIKNCKDRELELDVQQSKEKSRVLETRRSLISEKSVDLRTARKSKNLELVRQRTSKKSGDYAIDRRRTSKREDLEIMAVEDSDFYDFDEGRSESSFKKGQVWAIYDDDDGMPRHYGLIDEVVSLNPFEVKLSWLDLQNYGDKTLISWEAMGFHVSCGRFKVSRKTSINALNIFSHVVDCERAATALYRIYPKKGSVWALYNEAALSEEGGNLSAVDRRSYDIVVFLTTYSDMHGVSVAYLEKIEGYKSIFKRREMGAHAVKCVRKDDHLFSHQIPARKLTGDEVPDLVTDCWELDPASLPPDLLKMSWGR